MSELFEIHKDVEHSSDKWNSYFEVYEKHLKHYRGKDVRLIEVGVQRGGSLDMWSTYFGSNSKITGIDIDPECSKLTYSKNNINVVIGNQEDPAFWDDFLKDNPNIDIFIDDGGHTMSQQIVTFEKVFPRLKLGGTYICEDTHTSYWPGFGGESDSKISFIDYAKDYIDVLHYNWTKQRSSILEDKNKIASNGLSGISFYDSVVVFEKFGVQPMYRVIVDGKYKYQSR
jgi:hypothetical protein